MSTTIDFLKLVLPDEGYYVATIINQGKARNYFCNSVDRLAQGINTADRGGLAAYHACGTFKIAAHDSKGTPQTQRHLGRTAANCAGAKSFWADIDLAPKSKYPDVYAAAEHVAEFCRRTGLPPPVYVGSGWGLHIYWPLVSVLRVDEWKRYALGLKALCAAEGLEIDPARTADVASILRTPGTHNRKNGLIREVVCGPLVGPYPVEAFGRLLDERLHSGAGRISSDKPQGLAGALSATFSDEPRYARTIVKHCSQIKRLQESRGRLPEPDWYAVLGVLAFCADGNDLGHEWSSGYDRYTYEETQERLARARQLTGATTCEKFHSLNPRTCEACPHWEKIKSPISLGRSRDSGERERGEVEQQTDIFGAPLEEAKIDDLPELPHDFYWSKQRALVVRSEGGRGSAVDIVVSAYPIYLAAVQTGEIRGEWNFIFRQFIPERGWFDINIGASSLYSAQSASVLASAGANIHEHGHFIRYVRSAVDMHYRSSKLTMRYDQFGWKDGDKSFLYGLDLYSATGTQRITGNDELQIRCKEDWVGPCAGGDLDAWKQAINSLFALGCEPQSVALLASFAAPLMRFQERDEGGAIIHLVTRESGTGKSTALIGAASVWGRREGLGLTNDDTKVSKALTLGALGNLPVIYDELTIRDPEAIRAFVINFTNGRDKMRSTRAGEIRHTASTWQTLLISAANTSLVDALSLQNDPEAASMRIMEFPLELPEGLRHVQGDRLRKLLRGNSGHAGRVYIEYVVRHLPEIKALLERVTEQTWKRTGLEAKYRFWIRTIAAIGVAGAIVRKIGLIEFSIDRIMEWLFEQIKERHQVSSPWAVNALAEFLNQHRDAMLAVPRPYAPGEKVRPLLEPRQRLAIRYEMTPSRYLIACTTLREWLIKQDRSYQELVKSLETSGIVTRRRIQVTLGAGTDVPGGQVWCVEVNGSHELLAGVAPVVQSDNVVALKTGRG
jgi:Domain of unknown function (DUF927)